MKNSSMKKIFFSAIAIVAVFGSYWAYKHYSKLSLLNSKIQEAIGKDRGLTETILKIETESGTISRAF
jgi:hypothetical protein